MELLESIRLQTVPINNCNLVLIHEFDKMCHTHAWETYSKTSAPKDKNPNPVCSTRTEKNMNSDVRFETTT